MKVRKILLLLAMVIVLGFAAACGGNNDDDNGDGTDDAGIERLAGWYYIDMTPAGMPMVVFLQIREDGTFQLHNAYRAYDDNRGHGTVSGLDGTYMLFYSERDGATATFTVADSVLLFSTTIPFGTANVSVGEITRAYPIEAGGGNVPTPGGMGGVDTRVAALAGQYYVDMTPFGMPMRFYLTIEEDGSFELANAAGEVRDSGIVEVRMGGFTLVYDREEEARVNFTVSYDVLTFADRVPFGTVNVGSDEAGVYVTANPVSDDYVAPESGMPGGMGGMPPGMPGGMPPAMPPTEDNGVVGTFAAEYEIVTGMGAMTHNFTMELNEDLTFEFTENTVTAMGPRDNDFSGTYEVADGVVTFTVAEREPFTAEILEDGGLQFNAADLLPPSPPTTLDVVVLVR